MSSDPLDSLSYYRLLGVSPDATRDDVVRCFRTFGRKYHPDRFLGKGPEAVKRANQIYRRGSEAYQVLTNSAARALYDRALAQGILRLTADQRDRAAQKLRPPKKRAKPDFESIEAQQLYQSAANAMKTGEYRAAWKHLAEAYDLEPENKKVKDALGVVEDAIRKRR